MSSIGYRNFDRGYSLRPILVSLILAIPFGLICENVYGQSSVDFSWEPALSFSWHSSSSWQYNGKISLFNTPANYDNTAAIDYIEGRLMTGYTLAQGPLVGGGYQYRRTKPLDGGGNEHRLIEQVKASSKWGNSNFTHRFRIEQRFKSSGYYNRLRYRLGYDLPIKGFAKKEDHRYLTLGNEILSEFNSTQFEGENRLNLVMGWIVSAQFRFEAGLQHRAQDLFTDSGVHHLLLLTSTIKL